MRGMNRYGQSQHRLRRDMLTPATTPLDRSWALRIAAAAIVLLALLPGLAFADQPVPPPNVPDAIKVPEGNVVFVVGHASGTQNYVCTFTSPGYAWTLTGPTATLVDDKGKQIITHYAGPTWQARDGSKVVAAVDEKVTVDATAIRWLRLHATTKTAGPDGDSLTRATYIQGVNTTGGLAPAGGCNASSVGDTTNVPYTADYYFYRSK